MAVVQISRIQVRRGRKNSGTGFPQLASGEIGWAIDTQELYIGNGSVAEGSPSVGNTKILTERDITSQGNFLTLLRYTYKEGDTSIQTGPSANLPVVRPIQARLDDRVDFRDFVYQTDIDSGDYTAALRRAINQLYFNTVKASDEAGVERRVTLEIPAGVFPISESISIPSFATIVGAGAEKTVFQFSGTGSAFVFINDTNTILSDTLGNTQPRFITIKDLSIESSSITQSGLALNAVKHSTFENLILSGVWTGSINNANIGIIFDALSDIVTCEHNVFKNIEIYGFAYAAMTNKDIRFNTFDNCYIHNVYQGIRFGATTDNSSIGQLFGPRDTTFQNCVFYRIKRHGIYIKVGTENYVTNCSFENVGNNNGDHSTARYPQIFFGDPKNSSNLIKSDRFVELGSSNVNVSYVTLTLDHNITASEGALVVQSATGAQGFITIDEVASNNINIVGTNLYLFNTSDPLTINGDTTPSTTNTAVVPTTIGNITTTSFRVYIPEVGGHSEFKSYSEQTVSIKTTSDDSIINSESAFRLPVSVDELGGPQNSIIYVVEYMFRATDVNFIRQGTLYISADIDNGNVRLTDEYNFAGSELNENYLKLDFKVRFLDGTGATFVNPINQIPYVIDVKYNNTLVDGTGTLTYSYKSIF